MTRTIGLLLALLAAAGIAAAALWVIVSPRVTDAIAANFGQGSYRLETTDGQVFTQDSLKGAPSAVFFGYTHCPDVCPTTLGDIAGWQEELGKTGRKLRVFFVTVDPERDSTAMLRDYVSWVPGVVGISGSRAEIDKAIRAFRIYAQKVPGDDGGYGMDHTALLFLFDAQGRLREPIAYGEDETRALAALHRLLG